jgi:hypothetical protein
MLAAALAILIGAVLLLTYGNYRGEPPATSAAASVEKTQ